jgi:predicted enzyme related to lactoylglutathione lyase
MEGIVEFNVGGTWLQLSKGKTDSKEWVFRIGVDDLMNERKRIQDLGIKIEGVKTVPEIITYFDLIDPDKNRLSFYQLLRTG